MHWLSCINIYIYKFLVTLVPGSSSASLLLSPSSAHFSLLNMTDSSIGCNAGLRHARALYTGRHTPSQNPTFRRGSSCLSSLSIMGTTGASSSAFSRSPWCQNSSATKPAIWNGLSRSLSRKGRKQQLLHFPFAEMPRAWSLLQGQKLSSEQPRWWKPDSHPPSQDLLDLPWTDPSADQGEQSGGRDQWPRLPLQQQPELLHTLQELGCQGSCFHQDLGLSVLG